MKLKTLFSALVCAATPVCGLFANDNVPAPKQAHPVLLRGATVHTVGGDVIPDGQVLFAGGKIQSVGGRELKLELADGTEVIELNGKHLYPGMIAANTVLGLTEVRAVRATRDMIEPGRINPNARAQVAVNPDSELLPVTRSNGVLVAQVVPQANGSGSISGTSAVMALDGWTWEDMTVSAECGLHITWPRMVVSDGDGSEAAKKRAAESLKGRDERIAGLEEAFDNARAYLKARAAKPDT
ncbi:MAG: amidohydrolase family protein, partial [Verrucomicrobiales bacterium]